MIFVESRVHKISREILVGRESLVQSVTQVPTSHPPIWHCDEQTMLDHAFF